MTFFVGEDGTSGASCGKPQAEGDALLDLVLTEAIDLGQILLWVENPLANQKWREQYPNISSAVNPQKLEAATLAVVRNEAEGLFQSLDASSEAATPRTSEFDPSPGSTPHSKLTFESPNVMDKSQFPSLSSSKPSKGKQEKVPPAAHMRMVNSLRPPARGAEFESGRGSRSHRIAPTQVTVVECKPQFSAVVEDRGSAKKPNRSSTRIAPTKIEANQPEEPSVKGRLDIQKQLVPLTGLQVDTEARASESRHTGSQNQVVDDPKQGLQEPMPGTLSLPRQSRNLSAQSWSNIARSSPGNSDASTPLVGLEARLRGARLDSPCSSQGSTLGPHMDGGSPSEVSSIPLGSGLKLSKNQQSDKDLDEKYGSTGNPKKGKKGKGRSQQSGQVRTNAFEKPQRSSILSQSSITSSGLDTSLRNPGRKGPQNSTPQSRFRPSTPSEQSSQRFTASLDQPQPADRWPRLKAKTSLESADSLSFSHLHSTNTADTGSPKTPSFARAKIPGLGPGPGFGSIPPHMVASPAGTVYFSASEAGSPSLPDDTEKRIDTDLAPATQNGGLLASEQSLDAIPLLREHLSLSADLPRLPSQDQTEHQARQDYGIQLGQSSVNTAGLTSGVPDTLESQMGASSPDAIAKAASSFDRLPGGSALSNLPHIQRASNERAQAGIILHNTPTDTSLQEEHGTAISSTAMRRHSGKDQFSESVPSPDEISQQGHQTGFANLKPLPIASKASKALGKAFDSLSNKDIGTQPSQTEESTGPSQAAAIASQRSSDRKRLDPIESAQCEAREVGRANACNKESHSAELSSPVTNKTKSLGMLDIRSAAKTTEGLHAVCTPRRMSKKAGILAVLHGHFLKFSPYLELSEGLELLVHLLMLPERVNSTRGHFLSPKSPCNTSECFLGTGRIAAQYSLTVLSNTGNLLNGVSLDLLDSITEIAATFLEPPMSPMQLSEVATLPCMSQPVTSPRELRRSAHTHSKESGPVSGSAAVSEQRPGQAQNGAMIGAGPSLEAMWDLGGVINRLQKSVHEAKEKQSRAKPSAKLSQGGANSFSLLAFASDGLAKRTPEEQRKVSNKELCRDELLSLLREVSSIDQSLTSMATSAQTSGDTVFALIQNKAPALMKKIIPENIGHFSDLFLAAIMQTAVTGEVILDEELGKLAKQNLPKFQRLNQRLQAPGPSAQSSIIPTSSLGSGGPGQRLYGSARAKHGPPKASSTSEHPSRVIASNCPAALRVYILFLEAADSHRLNTCLERRLQKRIHDLLSEDSTKTSNQQDGQSLATVQAIALFLSYLQFAAPGSDSHKGSDCSSSLTVLTDLTEALRRKAADCNLMIVYMITQYLWFLPWDPGRLHTSAVKSSLHQLTSLSQRPSLRPGSLAFGQSEMCVRSLLEGLWHRLGLDFNQAAGQTAQTSISDAQPGSDDQHRISNVLLANDIGSQGKEPEWLEARVLQLCCPVLDQARASLKAFLLGNRRNVRSLRQRKITPSVPVVHQPQVSIPESVSKAAKGCQDADMLRLQAAFLDMYSTPDHQVKLRDVVNQVTSVVGQNTASLVLDTKILSMVQNSRKSEDVASEANRLVTLRKDPPTAENLIALLQPLNERDIQSTLPKVLEEGLKLAEQHAKPHVIRAVSAFSHHSWTEAVQGTAAAIILSSAVSLCANEFVSQMPGRVRSLIMSQTSEIARACLREHKEARSAKAAQLADTKTVEANG